jgi:hypothetical protein
MKFAKLGFKTQEGLSIAHFQDGWSMEYGKGGSYHCEVLFNGKIIAEAEEEGNGGPLNIWFKDVEHKDCDNAVLTFLKRVDKDYGPDSKYEWCRNITKASESEYSSMIAYLLDVYKTRKDVTNYLKKGYRLVASIVNNFQTNVVATLNPDEERLMSYIKSQNYYTDESTITFYTKNSMLNSII